MPSKNRHPWVGTLPRPRAVDPATRYHGHDNREK
jgi:hypothetical protein